MKVFDEMNTRGWKTPQVMRLSALIPLPRFVLYSLTSWTIAAVHVYLAYGHLTKLLGGDAEWVHVWKGFGALFGAYVFTALTSRRSTKSLDETIPKENDTEDANRVLEPQCHVENRAFGGFSVSKTCGSG
jgi:hypothetical protein